MEKTGRKFKCVGLKEVVSKNWNHYYKVGNVYPEKVSSYSTDLTICLSDENGYALLVDASQFELIK